MKKNTKKTLETVSLWLGYCMYNNSMSMKEEIYKMIPILCENIEDQKIDEYQKDDSTKYHRRAIMTMKTCFAPANVIHIALEMIWKVTNGSESMKAILAALDLLQVFVFANFMAICFHEDYVQEIESNVLKLIAHEKLEVRQKAATVTTL